ncbi:MAG TPA: hypothetical protein VHD91_05555 [Gaiellaceae bacterium]|nr:hypothetical protein [Gaiellaceae bacterium]
MRRLRPLVLLVLGASALAVSAAPGRGASPGGQVLKLNASPVQALTNGGEVTLTGTVAHASKCWIVAKPPLSKSGSGIVPADCSSGSVKVKLIIPRLNKGETRRAYSFSLWTSAPKRGSAGAAVGPGAAGLSVDQGHGDSVISRYSNVPAGVAAAKPPPSVHKAPAKIPGFQVKRSGRSGASALDAVPWQGGNVEVSGTLPAAAGMMCQVTGIDTLYYDAATNTHREIASPEVACPNGSFDLTFAIPPNLPGNNAVAGSAGPPIPPYEQYDSISTGPTTWTLHVHAYASSGCNNGPCVFDQEFTEQQEDGPSWSVSVSPGDIGADGGTVAFAIGEGLPGWTCTVYGGSNTSIGTRGVDTQGAPLWSGSCGSGSDLSFSMPVPAAVPNLGGDYAILPWQWSGFVEVDPPAPFPSASWDFFGVKLTFAFTQDPQPDQPDGGSGG